MAGFASASRVAENSAAATSTTGLGTTTLTAANVLNGYVVLLVVCTRVASGSPSVLSGTPSLAGVTATTPTQLLGFSDTLHNVEVWAATATADATASVSWSGTLSVTASRREMAIQSWSGFPTSWSVVASATNATTTNSTSWSCGAVDGVADDLLYAASILNSTDGTVTQNANATGSYEHGGASNISWRILTGTVTGYDATYSGTNSRIVGAALHLVLRESGGSTLGSDVTTTGTVAGDLSTAITAAASVTTTASVAADLTTAITAAAGVNAAATVTAALQTRTWLTPDADVSAGTWTPSTGTDLFAMVNDGSDSTYIRSASGAGPDTCELGFPAMGVPDAGPVTFVIRHRSV